jgi:hypothetical protein
LQQKKFASKFASKKLFEGDFNLFWVMIYQKLIPRKNPVKLMPYWVFVAPPSGLEPETL